jgi:hypothetical protein
MVAGLADSRTPQNPTASYVAPREHQPNIKDMSVRDLVVALERYDFECQGGPMRNYVEWRELQRRLGVEPHPLPSEKESAALE